jgi:diguanylate cyclase (GGDEF)-like protein
LAIDVFIASINPAVCAVLASALFVFWYNQRERTYIAVLSGGFALLAFGFALQYVSVTTDGVATRLLANGSLLVGAASVVAGTLGRYGRRPPVVPLVAVVGLATASFTWFLLIQPSVVARIYAVNFGCGLLVLLLAVELWKIEKKKKFDHFLIGLFAVWGAQFFLRTPLAVAFEDYAVNDVNFFSTLYWVTLTFSVAFFLLIFAVAIVAAIAMDMQEELRAESFTDPLSGLLNRRGFNTSLEKALHTAGDGGMPLALVVADLDRFKEINDRFGHAAGDQAIMSFAECLRAATGDDHVAGRMGGEEFAILLRGADLGMARLFAEGLRTSYAAKDIPGLPADRSLSASFGVAVMQPGEDWESLLRRADRALYRAKAEGRDRVVACMNADGPTSQVSVGKGTADGRDADREVWAG